MKEIETAEHASPGRLAWRRLMKNRTAVAGAIVLIVLYFVAVFAGFLSPYSPTDHEFRNLFFHPPTALHFRDENGTFHFRPYVARTFLADPKALTYSAGASIQICYRYSAGNGNPYLADTLEEIEPILVIRDPQGTILGSYHSLQETSENSGIFAATLNLDPFLLAKTGAIHVQTKFGDAARFEIADTPGAPDPASKLFLKNEHGSESMTLPRMVEKYPVKFFVRGWRYRILWVFESDLHLFGVEEPGHIFLLGTDQSGRDQFSRILHGAQISLSVGLFGVLLTTIFGLLIGGIAGFYGGLIDSFLMRFAEVVLSIPALYLILSLRNIIPDRMQETYDRLREIGLQTFAWHNNPLSFLLIVIFIVLFFTYYSYRNKWNRPSIALGVFVVSLAVAGPWFVSAALWCAQQVVPGSTYLTSEWTYLMIILILTAVSWASMARVIRGMVLSLRREEYVLAAQALGARDFRVILRHILPNTFGYVIVRATLLIPAYILGEVALSFLALGVQEPTPSWGNMLTQAQNLRILTQFTWTLAPGFFIFLTVLSYNLFGDGLRDAFDPKL